MPKAKKPVAKKRVVKAVKKAVRKAVKKIVQKEEPKEETPKVPETPKEVEVEAKEEVVKPLPVYNGKQVTQILSSGHTKEFYHCAALEGENRVTLHVPRSLF